MESLPYELVAQIATKADPDCFYAMLLTNKDWSKLLLDDFVLKRLLPKILRKWSFVSKLIEDTNLTSIEKIKFQLQRRNNWFLPDSKAKLSLIHKFEIFNYGVSVDGERLVIIKTNGDRYILATLNLHTLESATIDVGTTKVDLVLHKGNYFTYLTKVVALDKSNDPYDLEDISPTRLITHINPNIICDTLTASIGQTQFAVFDLSTKQVLVKFEDNIRTILYPSSYIAEPVTNQRFSEFIIGNSLPKGEFSKNNNKIAFLIQTKILTLMVIEMDHDLQNIKNWHSVDLDVKFLPHSLYPTPRYVGLVAKRAVQVYDMATGQMSFKRKFDTGPPVHSVRMTNKQLLLLSDYTFEIVDLDSNKSTIFNNPTFRSIVSVTQDLVFLSTEEWPVVIDLTTKKIAYFGGVCNYFDGHYPIEKDIPYQFSMDNDCFVGGNEQQLIFASSNTIEILDIEKTPDKQSPFNHVTLPLGEDVVKFFNKQK